MYDEVKNKSATIRLKTLTFKGKVLNEIEKSIEIKSNTSAVYFSKNLRKIISKKKTSRTVLLAELVDENNMVFDESLFFFETPNKLDLVKPNINFKVSKDDKDRIVVEIESDVLAKNMRLSTSIEGRFLNNYFDVLPAKKYHIYFESKDKVEIENFKEKLKIMSLYNSYEK